KARDVVGASERLPSGHPPVRSVGYRQRSAGEKDVPDRRPVRRTSPDGGSNQWTATAVWGGDVAYRLPTPRLRGGPKRTLPVPPRRRAFRAPSTTGRGLGTSQGC